VAAFGATLPLQDIADTRWRDLSLTSDEAAIQTGTLPVVPLVLRANAGDCLSIMLRNDLPALAKNQLIDFKWGAGQTRVRITPPLLLFDPQGSYGAAIGLNLELTTLFLNFANESQQMHGSFGAIIAEPAGSTYTNLDGSASSGAGLQLDIHNSARYSDRLAAGRLLLRRALLAV